MWVRTTWQWRLLSSILLFPCLAALPLSPVRNGSSSDRGRSLQENKPASPCTISDCAGKEISELKPGSQFKVLLVKKVSLCVSARPSSWPGDMKKQGMLAVPALANLCCSGRVQWERHAAGLSSGFCLFFTMHVLSWQYLCKFLSRGKGCHVKPKIHLKAKSVGWLASVFSFFFFFFPN